MVKTMKAEGPKEHVTLSISVWFKEQEKIPEGENILNLVFQG